MPSGSKVHKSLRIESGTAERVRALVRDGESEASAYNRVLIAGLDAMESEMGSDEQEVTGEGQGERDDAEAMHAVSETIAALREQLAVKDEQIRTLSGLVEQSQVIAKQSQQLHAMAEAKSLPTKRQDTEASDEEERRGWWSRHFGRRQ